MGMDLDKFRKTITIGVDKNILVYDADAYKGQFTPRLIALITACMQQNYNENLETIYISPTALSDIHHLFYKTIPGLDIERFKICGAYIVTVPELDVGCMDSLMPHFNSLGASLQSEDIELVIGIGDKGTPILGSF